MKKRLLLVVLALVFCFASMPLGKVWAAKAATTTVIMMGGEEDGEEEDNSIEDEESGDNAGELTKYDLAVSPEKKTLKVGKSFTINVLAADDSEWEDYPDEEWEEILAENIDNISFRSTKSSVASVNKVTGKVKAKKKGTAVIKTTIDLANGESVTFKTKVYVTK